MSPTKKEKQKLEQECVEGNTDACTDLGKAQAEKHKKRYIADAPPFTGWRAARFILIAFFWVSILVLYILSMLYIISYEILWIISPFLLAFGVLMVKGEQNEGMPRVFWVAGIVIPLTIGIFVGWLIFVVMFDWTMFFIWIVYIALMFSYIGLRAWTGPKDGRGGVLIYVLLITLAVAIAMIATGVVLYYMEMLAEIYTLLWIIGGFLTGFDILLISIMLWRIEKPPT